MRSTTRAAVRRTSPRPGRGTTWSMTCPLRQLPSWSHAHGLATMTLELPVRLRVVPLESGTGRALGLGLAMGFAWGPGQAMVLCRHIDDIARWKRYRGGRVGQLWIDPNGDGTFARLPVPDGNVASPLWIGGRIWCVSDHEFDGNLYSCRTDGTDLTRHTHHEGHFVRWPDTDGRHSCMRERRSVPARLATGLDARVPIRFHSPRTQTQRRFVPGAPYLQHAALHPDGHSFAAVCRGKLFVLGNWEGPVRQLGVEHGVRYRLPRYLPMGEALLVVSDEGGEEAFEIRTLSDDAADRLEGLDVGRVLSVQVNPTRPVAAVTNQRQ